MELIPNITVTENRQGNDYVVGDIHGHYDELMILLESVEFNAKFDRLFSTGDLMDRGPDSEKCLALLDESWFYAVLGNHEHHYLKQMEERVFAPNKNMGDEWLLPYSDNNEQISRWEKQILANMPVTLTIPFSKYKIGLVHAAPTAKWPTDSMLDIDEDDVEFAVWERADFYHREHNLTHYPHLDFVIMGHNPVKKITMQKNYIWIDTRYLGGELSILPLSKLIKC